MAGFTQVKTVVVDNGIEVFYREAYPASVGAGLVAALPIILLLHGFPSSSFQYRNLIPILAQKYRVIAPDFPGYGFTVVPAARNYSYTFESLTTTTAAFLDALEIKNFTVYVFDYGAPTAFRLALQRPEAVTAIVSQSGNAYVEGLGQGFWGGVEKVWANPTPASVEALKNNVTSFDTTKWQYTTGAPDPSAVPPETYNLDYYLMTRPGNADIQVGYLVNYKTNVDIYPDFQKYFREHQPPLLAIWGKGDQIFVPPGAEAFKKDLPNAVVKFVDAGHFALENGALKEIGDSILAFLGEHGI
ncbi:alpha/beta hydrolase fold protein [Polyporus arcularius HHB13444]|uniref:Alpha/beta hydrolase fold protein n=1 Tax=Polyporus arcularius HHB13444 TaxID=1314778 RepID=A0A5C3PPU1_9APHY|nr:alpha/beta hydrolase fold protein [Polyporus arcularius HHB13444]